MASKFGTALKKKLQKLSRSNESNNAKAGRGSKKLPSEAESVSKSKPPTTRKIRTRHSRGSMQASVSKESQVSNEDPKSRMSLSKLEQVTAGSISIDLNDIDFMLPPTPQNNSSKKKKDKSKSREVKKEDDKSKQRSRRTKVTKKSSDKKVDKPKPNVKVWAGMEAALKFFENNRDIDKLRAEYTRVESLTCNKTTTAFEKNASRNRERAPKIYDENRVVLNRPGQDDINYINASLISVKDFAHKLIVAQLPLMENESFVEDFWQMIYQEQITLVYLLVPDDALKKAPTRLFKEASGEYQYIGKMFINNRRTEPDGDPKKYTIEVLPEGNSDSVICQVHHHSAWPQLQQAPKPHRIIKMIHQFLTEKEIQSAGVCVVSLFGSGRACSFIGALIAINQLNKGIEPNICEIMTNIKQQRAGAIESFAQYAGIYAIVLDYIARKRGTKTNPINREMNRFIDDLADITPPPSPV